MSSGPDLNKIAAMAKPDCKGYVVLGRAKGANSLLGVIERSFSMDLSPDFVNFFWTGVAYDNLFGARWDLDGFKEAHHYRDHFAARHPEMEFEVHDVHDPGLPVLIDWDRWREAEKVRNKFHARNPRFYMRD